MSSNKPKGISLSDYFGNIYLNGTKTVSILIKQLLRSTIPRNRFDKTHNWF